MKIAHVVDSMEVGGAETLVSQMCRLQREQGQSHASMLSRLLALLGSGCEQKLRRSTECGRHLPDRPVTSSAYLKLQRPDVVHLHNPTPTIYAAMAARIAGVPSIVSTRHSLVAPPRNLVMELKYTIAANFATGLWHLRRDNEQYEERAQRTGAKDCAHLQRHARSAASGEGTAATKSGFTLVYVGRLEAVKNHVLLLNAFRAALSSMPDLRLWMVGMVVNARCWRVWPRNWTSLQR